MSAASFTAAQFRFDAADAQQGAPATGSRIAAASAIGIDFNHGSVFSRSVIAIGKLRQATQSGGECQRDLYQRSRSIRITLLVLDEKVLAVVHSLVLVSPFQIS